MDLPHVDLDKLKISTCRLIDEVRRQNGTAIMPLGLTFYWTIPPRLKYNLVTIPDEFEVGNVVDDIELTENIDYSCDRVATYSLSEIAEILHAIAETLLPKETNADVDV